MRITKKFAGSSAIGKQVFIPCDPNTTDPKLLKQVQVVKIFNRFFFQIIILLIAVLTFFNRMN